jgi:hypothetical protein
MVTSYPLRAVLQNPNVTGNIAKWATELAKFELDFVARHAIKSQVLTDFIAEWKPLARQPKIVLWFGGHAYTNSQGEGRY